MKAKELDHDFWRPNRSRPGKRQLAGFRGLSVERKILLVALCLFVLSWSLYMGLVVADAVTPPWEGFMVTSQDLNGENLPMLSADDGMEVILAVGCDRRPNDVGRTDTILLVFLNPENGDIKVLSIPRDTYVTVKGSKTKINHAYAYGGIPLTESTIEKAFGIKVDHYLEADFNGFAELIDALGGVTIDVEKNMYTPDEGINLKKGVQKLNGTDALAYVRFRQDGLGDIGRIQRQQKFLAALAEQVKSNSSLLKIPKLVEVALDCINTDFSAGDLLALANTAINADLNNMELVMLPGTDDYIGGVSYWIMDEDETEKTVDYLYGRGGTTEPEPAGEPEDAA